MNFKKKMIRIKKLKKQKKQLYKYILFTQVKIEKINTKLINLILGKK
ncbi:hypothetical protein LCGC14_1748130 [marine sediment metagenome]|uniref:Uncharacterized protein n=1 Tax=marine sediment metagenome TaxID=412755 RepID=A0A0F9H4Q0_9ZZZZ